MKVRTQQNETLDALIWRHYGYTRGMTEQVLMVNHGLADLGPILPHGILVELPELTPAVTTKNVAPMGVNYVGESQLMGHLQYRITYGEIGAFFFTGYSHSNRHRAGCRYVFNQYM